MEWNFPHSKRFTDRHKRLSSFFPYLSTADLDALIAIARHLSSTHSDITPDGIVDHPQHQPPINPPKFEKRKTNPGKCIPDDADAINRLKTITFNSKEFIDWHARKNTPWDLDTEWENFTLHAVLNRRRFKSETLEKGARIGFMVWLSQPFKHHMMSEQEQREKALKNDPGLSDRIKRAKELRRDAVLASQTKTSMFNSIFRGLLENEGISYEEIKDLI